MHSTTEEATVPSWLQEARGHGWLARLSDALVAEMLPGSQRLEFPKGAVGLRWDEEPKTAVVLHGTARGFLSYPDGSQVTTRYLRPGDLTGVFAARQPRIARGIQALEPCSLLIIEAARMKQLSLAHPPFAWALIEEMTSVLNTTHRALYVRAYASVRQRVALTIMDLALLKGSLTAGQTITGTQSELATAAGTVREVVASALHDLKREGIVDVRRGAVVIADPVRLQAEAGEYLAMTPS